MDIESNKFNLSDKLATMIGFTVILMTIYNFNDSIRTIELNFLIGTYNLGNLILIGAGLIIFSLYLHALNSIRFESPKLLNFQSLKYIEITGHGIYLTVLFLPILLFFLIIINKLVRYLITKFHLTLDFNLGIHPLNSLIVICITILTIYSFKHYNRIDKELIEEKETDRKNAYIKTKLFLKQKNYNQIPSQLYTQIISKFQEILILQYGNNITKLTEVKILNLGIQNNLLNSEEIQKVLELKNRKNTLIHKEDIKTISKKEITTLIKEIEKIILKLNRKEII